MDKNKYSELVKRHTPKEDRLKNGVTAFVVGGLMGVIGHFLLQLLAYWLKIPMAQAGTFMMITLIFFGCLFTSLGFFDKWVGFAKAGLLIPITGFAHAMMSAALDYRKEGMITGIGANMFKLTGSVIVFGIVSAYVFGLIRLLVFGG